MVDQNKRRTLKIISGAGTAAIGGMVVTGTAMTAGTVAAASTRSDSEILQNNDNYLKIQIVTGQTAPEDTVIFINDTEKDILVNEFLPGLVTQNNQMLDLNTIVASDNLLVRPGYPVTSKIASWEVLSLESMKSYLWCDTAVSNLPNSDTGIITLKAAVANGRAMLTPIHEEIGFS